MKRSNKSVVKNKERKFIEKLDLQTFTIIFLNSKNKILAWEDFSNISSNTNIFAKEKKNIYLFFCGANDIIEGNRR